MFSTLSSKFIFKVPLNGLYVLRPMIHDTCIFIEYETGAIGDHVNLIKQLIFSKEFSRLSSNYISILINSS